MKSFIKNFYPQLVIFGIVCILFILNFKPGTFLTGWDNLHPEYNFWLNFKRTIFASWQEYQGVGLLGGMGHASDLLHQLLLMLLSLVLPTNMLRYVFHFLMLFLGGLGTYYFVRKLFGKDKKVSLAAGLFYLLNLATIQNFYAPYEAFSAHFAALPWLLFSSIQYFLHRSKKNLLFLSLILFLATPSQYIPTLFVTYCIALTISLIVIGLNTSHIPFRTHLKSFLKLVAVIFVINAFWLLPFMYSTAVKGKEIAQAKINQMATETNFLQNKEFGDIPDVMLLKGFVFNSTDPNKAGDYDYMLKPWRDYFTQTHLDIVGYILFVGVLFGFVIALRSKNPAERAVAIVFVFAFTMLATSTPPFSWIDDLFRKLPLLNEAFRFPFTKFSTLTSLTYAVLFCLGLEQASIFFRQKTAASRSILYAVYCILLAALMLPAFTGNFFYDKERLAVPQEYFDLFKYFQSQDPSARIADFPQFQFWSWTDTNWGFGGSGFLWYGIPQPILDRAFDPWSRLNENYFDELSAALYARDQTKFVSVLDKYQISFLLVDKNVINPNSAKSLFYTELADLITHSSFIHKAASFGAIDVYKVDLTDHPLNFVFLKQQLPSANSYTWGDNDTAYPLLGDYAQSSGTQTESYPFRSFFSNKTVSEQQFTVKENLQTYQVENQIQSSGTLTIPDFLSKEDILPFELLLDSSNNKLTLTIHVTPPQLFIDDKKVWGQDSSSPLVLLPTNATYPLTIDVNGVAKFSVNKNDVSKRLGNAFLVRNQENIIVISDSNKKVVAVEPIDPSTINVDALSGTQIELTKKDVGKKITLIVPKLDDSYLSLSALPNAGLSVINCDNFRRGSFSSSLSTNGLTLSAKNADACLSYYNSNLPHNEGYVLFLDMVHQEGRYPLIWLLNEDEAMAPINTYLTQTDKTNSFVVPPMENFGSTYSLHIENQSIGSTKTVNTFSGARMFEFPYRFATDLKIENQIPSSSLLDGSAYFVKHPNESLYDTKIVCHVSGGTCTLVLSQGFDKGWAAYTVSSQNFLTNALPFIFGKKIGEHVLVNNWENGWTIPNNTNSNIVIVFLPQYLEYLGFLVLPLFGIYLLLRRL